MKKYAFFLFTALCLSAFGCHGVYRLPSDPSLPTPPTATATPNLTPVCGVTPITMPLLTYKFADSGIQVIQNAAQWYSFDVPGGIVFYPTPVPTPAPPPPPVDFNNQMIVTAGEPQPCNNTVLTITNVCEGPNFVTVYVTSSTCTSCPMCNVAADYCLVTAVAVPQCNLPVSVVTTYVTY